MVAPLAVDMQVCWPDPFLRQAKLFDDAQTLGVFRPHADLNAMQPYDLET